MGKLLRPECSDQLGMELLLPPVRSTVRGLKLQWSEPFNFLTCCPNGCGWAAVAQRSIGSDVSKACWSGFEGRTIQAKTSTLRPGYAREPANPTARRQNRRSKLKAPTEPYLCSGPCLASATVAITSAACMEDGLARCTLSDAGCAGSISRVRMPSTTANHGN